VKDWHIAIEILGSETVKDFMNKSYPINTIPVSALSIPEAITNMMKDLDMHCGITWDFFLKKNMGELK